MNKAVSSGKISNICRQYELHQIINEHTHFNERSSSLIDIILTSNPNSILLSGVGDPFLNQEIWYHCPMFSVFKFALGVTICIVPDACLLLGQPWLKKCGYVN